MRWTGHAALTEERWWGHLNETDHLEDLGRDGITILKGIFREIGLGGGARIGLHWLKTGTGGTLL